MVRVHRRPRSGGDVILAIAALAVVTPQDFGAVPDDGRPDNVGIQAALEHGAATGTEVYLACGVYDVETRVALPGLGNPTRIMGVDITRNARGFRVRGDGPCSVIRMAGDGLGQGWWMIGLDHARDVAISDLMLDGSGRTGGYAEQQHLINVIAGSRRITVERVVVRHPRLAPSGGGDCLRLVGSAAEPVENVAIRHVTALYCDRSVIGLQRAVKRVTIEDVLAVGTGDQDIDMEPTGVTGPADAIEDVTITRLRSIRTAGGVSVSIRASDVTMSQSTIVGGSLYLVSCQRCSILDTSITGDASVIPVVAVRRASKDVHLINVSIARSAPAAGTLVHVYSDQLGAPDGTTLDGCTLAQGGAAAGVQADGAGVEVWRSSLVYGGPAGNRSAVAVSVRGLAPPPASIGGGVHLTGFYGPWFAAVRLSAEGPGGRDAPVTGFEVTQNVAHGERTLLRCELGPIAGVVRAGNYITSTLDECPIATGGSQ